MATEQTIFDYTFSIDVATDIKMLFVAKQVYSNTSGSKPWQVAVYFDNVLNNYAGGATAYTDAIALMGFAINAQPGTHRVRFTWFGDSSMQLRGINALVEGIKRTGS